MIWHLDSTAFLPEVDQVFHCVAVALDLQSAQLEFECIRKDVQVAQCNELKIKDLKCWLLSPDYPWESVSDPLGKLPEHFIWKIRLLGKADETNQWIEMFKLMPLKGVSAQPKQQLRELLIGGVIK